MSFNNNQVIVYNLYGQRVILRIKTEPNCFGYIDIVDDEVGQYCLSHFRHQALELHDKQYSERYVDRQIGSKTWDDKHAEGVCQICDYKRKCALDLKSVPNFDLRDFFYRAECFDTYTRSQRLPLLPKPDINTSSVAKIPSDEETIKKLRSKVLAHKNAVMLMQLKVNHDFKEQFRIQKELRNELIWYRKECQEATKIIRRYHVILNALPEKAKVFSVEAEAALKRKLSDMYV